MAPFGYSLWVWFRSNPAAQWVAGITVAYVTFRIWLARKIGRERKEAAQEAREEVVEVIEAKEDKLKEAANEAENRVTADLNTRSLRNVAANSPENLGPVRRDQQD